ncbi:YHS domain-containing (seleno)protein [Roseovarius sp. EL26]|uniref:YHS domain-containing (seleno)protein n=1 Tax=Roseovarius sp. EL26 TaxID=2126672 RepID=UPI000EA191B8|nr:YHS domain-containing (seleno)protein [Roseovarius sp. EL26]
MTNLTKRGFLSAAIVWVSAPVWAASEPYWFTGKTSYGAQGADVVAYFGLNKRADAIIGNDAFRTKWKGVQWRFSNAQNMAVFKANPAKYAPRFGGYCSLAMANGYLASGDPGAWSVINGRLYLNYSKSVRSRWLKKANGNIRKAQEHWPSVLNA